MSNPAHTATADRRLADGTEPLAPAVLLARLDALGIRHETFEHPAVFTVDEAKRQRGALGGAHVKNLFLRNKKGQMWLVTCLEDRTIDLRRLADRLGAGRFSFASPERLMRHLGVIPGAVTAFGVINDVSGSVRVVLDATLLEAEILNLHPLDNAMTTALSPAGLLRFLEAVGHEPTVVDLDTLGAPR